jgi:hypothetical protein
MYGARMMQRSKKSSAGIEMYRTGALSIYDLQEEASSPGT